MNHRRKNRFVAEGVYLVSLGCPKNLVDSEVMARILLTNGILLNFDKNTAEYLDFDQAVKTCDVINLLRVQFERHQEAMKMTKEEYHKNFGMTAERVAQMKNRAIIMHPAPINRGIEIASEVAKCEKSRIYTQSKNGVNIKMAVITLALQENL